MGKTIILISCVSQKLSKPVKARDLYTSTLFKLNLRYAEQLNPGQIFILSAKHGLLDLDDVVEPYDLTLNNMAVGEIRDWAEKVVGQLHQVCSLQRTHFIFLAGEKYRKYLIPHLWEYSIPLEGLRIGEQLRRLKELIK